VLKSNPEKRIQAEFEFDEAVMLEDPENIMSDEDLLQHAATCFTEDIEQMVKYNELFSVALAQTSFVDDQVTGN